MSRQPTITYLVQVHHKPAQFQRLVERLTSGGSTVVVHVDAAADQRLFAEAARAAGAAVHFTARRRNVRWGGFGSVATQLTLLREARTHRPADYYVLISGADYPIRPEADLRAELASGATYLESWAMPNRERGKPLTRLEYYYFPAKDRLSPTAARINRWLHRLPKRNVARGLGGRRPYGGSTWWAFPDDVARQVLEFVAREKRFVRFFRFTKLPDEMFFQTVVEALEVGERRPPLVIADWSRRVGKSPATLGPGDLAWMREHHGFFARKFDLDRDPDVFDRIDAELLGGQPRSAR